MNDGTGALTQAAQTISATAAESSPGGGFLFPSKPNIVDYLNFLQTQLQIPAAALPPSSPWPQYSLDIAIGFVPLDPVPIALLYTLAVYNCAAHTLLQITPDVPGQNWFATARSNQGYNLANPSTGLVSATSDESTSVTLAQPEWAERLTVGQLDFYKTPWGRYYLSYIQSSGPTIWGLT